MNLKTLNKIEISFSRTHDNNDKVLGALINSETSAAYLARELIGNSIQEVVLAFMLAVDNTIIGYMEVAKGCMDSCVVDPKFLFIGALRAGASGILLAHNHPSGNVNPSREDIEMTKRIVKGAELLEIRVVDHVIVSDKNSYSFLANSILRAV